jgi:hypothetical protein
MRTVRRTVSFASATLSRGNLGDGKEVHMKAMMGVATVVGVLVMPAAAGAATTKCRIEKPARPTYGSREDFHGPVRISHLVAKNLPRHHTFGGSPCATANRLAWEYEFQLTNPEAEAESKGLPLTLETAASNQPGREVPRYDWVVEETGLKEPRCNVFSYTATFTEGRQSVSLHAVVHLNFQEPCRRARRRA